MEARGRNWGIQAVLLVLPILAAGCQPGSEPITSNGGTGGSGAGAGASGTAGTTGGSSGAAATGGVVGTGGSIGGTAGAAGTGATAGATGGTGAAGRGGAAGTTAGSGGAGRGGTTGTGGSSGATGTGGSGAGGTGSALDHDQRPHDRTEPEERAVLLRQLDDQRRGGSVVQFGVGSYQWEIADPAQVTTHRVLVIGMRQMQTYKIKAISGCRERGRGCS